MQGLSEEQPEFAVRASVYGKVPNAVRLDRESWHSKQRLSETSTITSEEASDAAEESSGSETNDPSSRDDARRRRSVRIRRPVRV